MSLVTSPQIYKPEFNTTTGKYFDVCPYDSGQRNRPVYRLVFSARRIFFSVLRSSTSLVFRS